MKQPKARLDAWAEAQRRFHLSDLPIQMARELGLNPKQFGGLANHRQEPWKLPLPECIAECYRKRFHRDRPAKVVPLAEAAFSHQSPSNFHNTLTRSTAASSMDVESIEEVTELWEAVVRKASHSDCSPSAVVIDQASGISYSASGKQTVSVIRSRCLAMASKRL